METICKEVFDECKTPMDLHKCMRRLQIYASGDKTASAVVDILAYERAVELKKEAEADGVFLKPVPIPVGSVNHLADLAIDLDMN